MSYTLRQWYTQCIHLTCHTWYNGLTCICVIFWLIRQIQCRRHIIECRLKTTCLLSVFGCLENRRSRRQYIKRAAEPGKNVLLPCLLPDANVNWQYTDNNRQDAGHLTIVHDGVVLSEFEDRFQLHWQGLLIRNVQQIDAGTYTCGDHHHHHHRRQIRLFIPCE